MLAVSTARMSGEEKTVSTWGYSNRSFSSASWARALVTQGDVRAAADVKAL